MEFGREGRINSFGTPTLMPVRVMEVVVEGKVVGRTEDNCEGDGECEENREKSTEVASLGSCLARTSFVIP